jgi:hypothetical protein
MIWGAPPFPSSTVLTKDALFQIQLNRTADFSDLNVSHSFGIRNPINDKKKTKKTPSALM